MPATNRGPMHSAAKRYSGDVAGSQRDTPIKPRSTTRRGTITPGAVANPPFSFRLAASAGPRDRNPPPPGRAEPDRLEPAAPIGEDELRSGAAIPNLPWAPSPRRRESAGAPD